MKKWSKILVIIGTGGCLLTGAGRVFANTADDAISGDILAIQQASDPSAAITAFANGIATDRNSAKIYTAYVSKMVELGLPEMAFHQAQTLTGMESNNGLAWGVVAYVNARRGQMPDAISAVVLAGQFAPDNAFVQRTAGELAAWYDLKADKSTLSDSTKDAMTKVRIILKNRPTFADAYNTATKAYQSQGNTTPAAPAPSSAAPGAPTTQPQSYADQPQNYAQPLSYDYGTGSPPYPYYSDYYPDYGYYNAWGPGWVAPAAWWWWPVGSFGGCAFFPFSTFVVFDHHDHFHGHSHDGHSHSQDGFVAHHDGSFHATHNGGKFFGGSTHPNFAARTAGSSGFHSAIDTRTANTTATRTRSLSMNSSALIDTRTANTTGTRTRSFSAPTTTMNRSFATGAHTPATSRSWTMATPRMRTAPSFSGHTWNSQAFRGARTGTSPAFANRTWSSPAFSSRPWAPQSGWTSHSFSAPALAPRGGGFSVNGGFHGGGMGGGGFRGGGGGFGGGHGGGGHR
jgi:hypothetical protein